MTEDQVLLLGAFLFMMWCGRMLAPILVPLRIHKAKHKKVEKHN